MADAFAVARAIDGRLVTQSIGDADIVVEAFTEVLYDYRADGELEAFIERCQDLLEDTGDTPEGNPVEGRCFRALDSVFSSG